jgi:hypothetical protein
MNVKHVDEYSLYVWNTALADPSLRQMVDRWCELMDMSHMTFLRLVDGLSFGKRTLR